MKRLETTGNFCVSMRRRLLEQSVRRVIILDFSRTILDYYGIFEKNLFRSDSEESGNT